MKNRDTFEQKDIILFLDKPYSIKFTMQSVYLLEDIYGSINNAVDKLRSENTEDIVVAAIDFLYALVAVPKSHIEDCLTVDKLIDAIHKIKDSINLHFPEPVENETKGSDDPWDWDALYYIARYHLHMTDSEFMDCTPRRFHKLNYLWRVENGLVPAKPKEAFIDEIMF